MNLRLPIFDFRFERCGTPKRKAKVANLKCLLCAVNALAAAAALAGQAEPLRIPAAIPVLERTSWQQTLDTLNAQGAPRQWVLLGPVPVEPGKVDAATSADARDDWENPLKDHNGQLFQKSTWTRPDDDGGCFVELGEPPAQGSALLGYARAEVDWPLDGPALMWFECTGYTDVYVNGSVVRSKFFNSRPSLAATMLPVPVRLRQGLNVLRVRLDQSSGKKTKQSNCGFYLRLERNDSAYRISLLENLMKLYPLEAQGWRGAAALLEIAHRYEKDGRTKEASEAYGRLVAQYPMFADYIAEGIEGRKRVEQNRGANETRTDDWDRTDQEFYELLWKGNLFAADNVLVQFIARNPFHEGAGTALLHRGVLRRNMNTGPETAAIFERGFREFPPPSAQKFVQSGVLFGPYFVPDVPRVVTDSKLQMLLETVSREVAAGKADGKSPALAEAMRALKDEGGALVRLECCPPLSYFTSLRNAVRAILAASTPQVCGACEELVGQDAQRRYEQARAERDVGALFAVANEFPGTAAEPQALNLAGNLGLDRGEYSSAASAFKALLARREAVEGISAAVVKTKLAHALSRSGPAGTDNQSPNSRRLVSVPAAFVMPAAPAWHRTVPRSATMEAARKALTFDIHGPHLQSHAVAADGRVFLTTQDFIAGWDLAEGRELWRNEWDSHGGCNFFDHTGYPVSFPAVRDGRLFLRACVNGEPSIRCYDAAAGKLLWTTDSLPEFVQAVWLSEPLVCEGMAIAVFFDTSQNLCGLAAMDEETGKVRWRKTYAGGNLQVLLSGDRTWIAPAAHLGPPAAAGGVIYTPIGLGCVVAVSATTGDPLWLTTYPALHREKVTGGICDIGNIQARFSKFLARVPGPPVVDEDVVILAPQDARGLYAFERRSGRLRWKKELMDCRSLLGVCEGKVLTGDDSLVAMDLATGQVSWQYSLDKDGIYGEPSLWDGAIYASSRSRLCVVDARTGALRSSFAWPAETGPLANLLIGENYLIGLNDRLVALFSAK